jgi:hypothetical protein
VRPSILLLGRAPSRSTAARSLRKAAILNHACKRGGWPTAPSSPNLAFSSSSSSSTASRRPSLPPAIISPGRVDEAEDVRGEADVLLLARRRLQARVAAARRRSSPLGVSDYAALDEWRGFPAAGQDDGEEAGGDDEDIDGGPFGGGRRGSAVGGDEEGEDEDEDEVYSDFNFLDPVASSDGTDDDEEGEYDGPFAVLPQAYERRPPERRAPPPPQPQAGLAMAGLSPNWHAARRATPEVCG